MILDKLIKINFMDNSINNHLKLELNAKKVTYLI